MARENTVSQIIGAPRRKSSAVKVGNEGNDVAAMIMA